MEFTFSTPTFARIAVRPAKNADSNAQRNQLIFAFHRCSRTTGDMRKAYPMIALRDTVETFLAWRMLRTGSCVWLTGCHDPSTARRVGRGTPVGMTGGSGRAERSGPGRPKTTGLKAGHYKKTRQAGRRRPGWDSSGTSSCRWWRWAEVLRAWLHGLGAGSGGKRSCRLRRRLYLPDIGIARASGIATGGRSGKSRLCDRER